jgi:hypothetical protein
MKRRVTVEDRRRIIMEYVCNNKSQRGLYCAYVPTYVRTYVRVRSEIDLNNCCRK